jgi:carboxymethylenebutenolidase
MTSRRPAMPVDRWETSRLTVEVRIPVPGEGTLPAVFEPVDGASAPRPGVLVIHEALGLTPEMRRLARQFAGAGFVSLAPDFLHGLGPKPVCIARFAAGIGRGNEGRPYRRLGAAQAWLAARPEVDGQPIGVAGLCMGGQFALLYAAGADVQVVAPFYPLTPDRDALRGICPVVASYGERDAIFGPGAARLEAALTDLGVEHDVRTYPTAGHGFMTRYDGPVGWIGRRLPMRLGHDPAAADDAWARTVAFFRRQLSPDP